VIDVSALEGKISDVSGILGKEWSRESLELRVQEEMSSRGRKGTNIRDIAARLAALADISINFGPHVAIPTIMHAISVRFETSRGYDTFMDRGLWKRSVRDLSTVLSILEENKHLTLLPLVSEELATALRKTGQAAADAAGEGADEPRLKSPVPIGKDDPNVVRVVGELAVSIAMLQDEYIKALQHMDHHKSDYFIRIGDEQSIATVAERGMTYYERAANTAQSAAAKFNPQHNTSIFRTYLEAHNLGQQARQLAARLALLRVEQMYYKHDSVATQLRIVAAAADKRAEVAAIAASAAAQSMAEFRAVAVGTHKQAAQSLSAQQNQANQQQQKPGEKKDDKEKEKEKAEAEAVAKALAAAGDAAVVGAAAAKKAQQIALDRSKRGYVAAAGVVASALIKSLAAAEGSLLSAGAVAISRDSALMESRADVEATKALADAEAAGLDLQDLSTKVIAALAGTTLESFDSAKIINELSAYVYRHGEPRTKTLAMVFHIYHHALHDRFFAARDLLLMSKLQDAIDGADAAVKAQFNRSMVQLGISAFRAGMWSEAHECLADITGSGHIRELLAQGLSQTKANMTERDEDLDRQERRLMLPYHMHINTELADACCLTSAMLLEVPNIAAAEHDNRRREISRTYRRHLDMIDNKTFIGPPETTRDMIMMAGLALAEGDWERASGLITTLRVWSLWVGRGLDTIKTKLTTAIKEVGLVCYLHTYSSVYDSMSLAGLSEMFGLGHRSVSAIVSKQIYNNELYGKLDQPTGTLVLHRAPPSRLHSLALEYAERVGDLAEFNERSLAQRTGVDRFAFEDQRFRGPSGDGQYRRNRFDARKMGSAQFTGRPITSDRRGGRGGRGGPAGNRLARYAGYQGQGSGRREYKQRGY
jgi:hypothetical protein